MHVQEGKYQQVSNPKEGELYLLTPTHLGLNACKSITCKHFSNFAWTKTGQVVLILV